MVAVASKDFTNAVVGRITRHALRSMLAARDGSPEKLEASRKLEAFLAFTLQVDRDRFASP